MKYETNPAEQDYYVGGMELTFAKILMDKIVDFISGFSLLFHSESRIDFKYMKILFAICM